ncbi:hypothetical protein EVAR_102688_1 [Eumeta japonica]|uniref:Histone-lysine N-methyltransferase SETMAR n=1 Tax=Eumeta variegata TaxID=151549 RepID=A0A4C1TII3_EUMVA|nr:hypothetical protein EVAR_102688_1 [Eumeta japonica]
MQEEYYNWLTEFKRGRVNLSNEFHDGRPSTAVNNKNIDAVHRMIETDMHMTCHEIGASWGIGNLITFLQKRTQGAGHRHALPTLSFSQLLRPAC